MKFMIPTCSFCQEFKPVFEEFSESYQGENIVFAEVNCHTSKRTCRRFSIDSFPKLLLLHKHKLFSHEVRTEEGMTTFLDDIESNENGIAIPEEITPFIQWREELRADLKVLFKYKKNALFAAFSVGLVCGVLLKLIFDKVFCRRAKKEKGA